MSEKRNHPYENECSKIIGEKLSTSHHVVLRRGKSPNPINLSKSLTYGRYLPFVLDCILHTKLKLRKKWKSKYNENFNFPIGSSFVDGDHFILLWLFVNDFYHKHKFPIPDMIRAQRFKILKNTQRVLIRTQQGRTNFANRPYKRKARWTIENDSEVFWLYFSRAGDIDYRLQWRLVKVLVCLRKFWQRSRN